MIRQIIIGKESPVRRESLTFNPLPTTLQEAFNVELFVGEQGGGLRAADETGGQTD